MADNGGFLDKAYDARSTDDVVKLYDRWAESYDEELRTNGYASPARTAKAMAAVVTDLGAPLLDIGCGTGLSGEALKAAGFTAIDGTDFSAEMLAAARPKAVYRKLWPGSPENPLPPPAGDHANIAAIGVFSPSHAPSSAIATIVDRLDAGGCFGFTLNDHALEDDSYIGAIDTLVAAGTVAIAFEDYGDHLPGIGLKSKVFVLRRL